MLNLMRAYSGWRWAVLGLVSALPSGALACGNSFGGLDNHNAVWERVLGITFDNPVIKASSMNDRCWIEDRIDEDAIYRIAREVIATDKTEVVYSVPGIRIEPDYATYSDDREAYENGRRTPLGKDVFRIVLARALDVNRIALTEQLAGRNLQSAAGKEGKVENTQGEAEFGGVEVTLFTSQVKRPWKSDLYTSAAMFTAPGNKDLLVIFLGDTNFETDRVGGIRLEETLHQTLRDMAAVQD